MSKGKVKIKLNKRGVRSLLRSEEMGAVLKEKSSDIAARCGEGYESDLRLMSSRVISSVYTETPEAMINNEQNNTILGALK